MKKCGAVIFSALCASGSFAAEPLADFETIVRNCQTAFDAKPASTVAFMEKQQQWVKRVSAPAKVAYDVRKTESLVSPFTAYLEVTQLLSSKLAPDEATATALEVSIQEVYDTERHLLYVACTRARDQLLVTGVEPASEFLDDFLQGLPPRG